MNWLTVTGVQGGQGWRSAGQTFLLLDFGTQTGDVVRLAYPSSEAHALTQVAFQAVPTDLRNSTFATLVPHLPDPQPSGPGGAYNAAFEIMAYEIGVGEGEDIAVTLEVAETSKIAFKIAGRFASKMYGALREAAIKQRRISAGDLDPRPSRHPYITVAEDIEWLRDEWVDCVEPPKSSELRRATAVLRHLLLNNGITDAWRDCGLPGRPKLIAPNFDALMDAQEHIPEHSAIAFAGGVQIDGVETACFAARRIRNPETGVEADAEVGFAVEVGSVSRRVPRGDEKSDAPRGEFWDAVNFEWGSVGKYMSGLAAIRRGFKLNRTSVLKYFSIYRGGVHLERARRNPQDDAIYALHEELVNGRASILGVDGLYIEILAMGQAIGRSPDMHLLAKSIREQVLEEAHAPLGS